MKPIKTASRTRSEGLLIAIITLSSFIFLMFVLIFTYHLGAEERIMSPLLTPFVKYHVYFMILISSFGVAVGASVFYFMSKRIEHQEMDTKKNADIILSFLNNEEKAIIKKILESDGKILQSQLTRETGFGKVKIYRSIRKFSDRGIVKVEPLGKTNKISLNVDIHKSLE